uniref:HEAT repeat-containing protein 1-like n=1 Tax=Myxine glutinosa TaxID=7769 RepID=UPI00358E6267
MDAHSDIQKDAQQVVQITGYVFKSKSSVTASTLSILLDCLAKDDCPPDVAHAALCCLAEIDGLVILSKLLPVLERLLQRIVPRDHNSEETSIDGFSMAEAKLLSWALSKINTSSAKLLATEPRAMAILLLAIKAPASVTLPLPGQPRLQTIALRLITKKFFTALPSAALQRTVLSAMFDLLVDCRNPQTMHDVGFVFKGLSLNADMVAEELCLPKPIGRRTVLQRRRTNQKKTLCVEAGETQESPCEAGTQAEQQTRAWCRVTLILEMLQTKKKIQQPGMLLPALFGMLASCLESKDVETEDLEYPKQLVLACLQNICSRLKPGEMCEDRFNVELVVQCVRTSHVPQTYHYALLLLSTAASLFPEKVLHNIMPIFTFVGSSVLRLDDAFSFQVVSKTINTLVPILIDACHHEDDSITGESDLVVDISVCRILRVFTDAVPHIPAHRRLPVIKQLLEAAGPKAYLWAMISLLFEGQTLHAADQHDVDKEWEVEGKMEFAVSLCGEFEAQIQFFTAAKLLQYLASSPFSETKPSTPQRQTRQRSQNHSRSSTISAGAVRNRAASSLFDVAAHTQRQLHQFMYSLFSFLPKLLASHAFLHKVAQCSEAETVNLQPLQQNLLQESLHFVHLASQNSEQCNENQAAKFWKAMLNRACNTLEKVNQLLSINSFVPAVRAIMSHEHPAIRRKAIELLSIKLQTRQGPWSDDQAELLMSVLEQLLLIACGTSKPMDGDESGQEQALNRQTALLALKLLCRAVGHGQKEGFAPVITAMLTLLDEEDLDGNVGAGALLCAAEVVGLLGVHAVPHLPRLLPALLGALRVQTESPSQEAHLLSAVTALQRISAALPRFLSPYLLNIVMQAGHIVEPVMYHDLHALPLRFSFSNNKCFGLNCSVNKPYISASPSSSNRREAFRTGTFVIKRFFTAKLFGSCVYSVCLSVCMYVCPLHTSHKGSSNIEAFLMTASNHPELGILGS